MKPWMIYLLIINVFTFIIFGMDKYKASKNKWRIKESLLLSVSLIGGALGGLVAMKIYKHKTRKKKFSVGIPLIAALQISLVILLVQNMK